MHNQPSKVTLTQSNGNYQLRVNGKPFYIKGGGLEFGDIASLATHHGNSFRTWRTDNGQQSALQVLDEAHKYGLMVTMGIEVARERHGFDYNDTAAVQEQKNQIREQVLALKDHPALLIWSIGNELNLHYTNPKVWDAVNEISIMIHQLDPNHLTTTPLAGITQEEITLIKNRASDLDLLSIQEYGKLMTLPERIRTYGWEGAYMVTEWGATGHWEVPKTSWDAPIEENSHTKAQHYLKRYQNAIATDTQQCIGSYVFLWGQKQERTPTWYGLFLEDGKETESVDVMHCLWSNEWPQTRCPQINDLTINGKKAIENVVLSADSLCKATFQITSLHPKHALHYRWEILFESTDLKEGGDPEIRPNSVPFQIVLQQPEELLFKTPKLTGKYRLFFYLDDGISKAATANFPFQVK